MIRFSELYPVLDMTHVFITNNNYEVLADINPKYEFSKYHEERSKARALAHEDAWLVTEISLVKGSSISEPFIAVTLTKEEK